MSRSRRVVMCPPSCRRRPAHGSRAAGSGAVRSCLRSRHCLGLCHRQQQILSRGLRQKWSRLPKTTPLNLWSTPIVLVFCLLGHPERQMQWLRQTVHFAREWLPRQPILKLAPAAPECSRRHAGAHLHDCLRLPQTMQCLLHLRRTHHLQFHPPLLPISEMCKPRPREESCVDPQSRDVCAAMCCLTGGTQNALCQMQLNPKFRPLESCKVSVTPV